MYRAGVVEPVLADHIPVDLGPGGGPGPGPALHVGDGALPAARPQAKACVVQWDRGAPVAEAVKVEHLLLGQVLLDLLLLDVLQPVQGHTHELRHVVLEEVWMHQLYLKAKLIYYHCTLYFVLSYLTWPFGLRGFLLIRSSVFVKEIVNRIFPDDVLK